MGLLKSARHNLGFHTGDWEFDDPDSCQQTRRCTGCPDVSQRASHQLGDWVYRQPREDNLCAKDRMCRGCSLLESEQEHTFVWHYVEEILERKDLHWARMRLSRCEQVNVCAYCPTIEKGTIVSHSWGDSVWNGHESRYHHQCLRCKKVEKL
jgi:hypothetical protein